MIDLVSKSQPCDWSNLLTAVGFPQDFYCLHQVPHQDFTSAKAGHESQDTGAIHMFHGGSRFDIRGPTTPSEGDIPVYDANAATARQDGAQIIARKRPQGT